MLMDLEKVLVEDTRGLLMWLRTHPVHVSEVLQAIELINLL
jgi:hypothetical protein